MRLFRPHQRETTDVDPPTAHRLVAGGALLIDVREPHEFAAGHVPQAVNIPYGEVVSGRGTVVRTGDMVVICRSGARSGRAVDHLRKTGCSAVNLAGGMIAWERAGLPVTRGDRR